GACQGRFAPRGRDRAAARGKPVRPGVRGDRALPRPRPDDRRWRSGRSGVLMRRQIRAVPALVALGLLAGRPAAAQQGAAVELDSIRVTVGSRATAALPAATRAVQVISAEAISRAPVRTVAELLEWALGTDVQARSGAQADLALRGGTSEQVLVLVDGMRMSDAQTSHFDLDLAVPLSEIERIEILR